jgi:hypothetical protein
MIMARPSTKKHKRENEWRTILPKERRRDNAPWQKTYAMYVTGQAWVNEVTLCAERMEHKWGAGRLRLMVGPELRDKFDRQRYMLNQALYHGSLEDVRVQCKRMITGWGALDRAADEIGLERLPVNAWEVSGDAGVVHVIVRTLDDAIDYRKGRQNVAIYTLDEIAVLLDAQGLLGAAKAAFPDAEIIKVQRNVGDALDDIEDTQNDLDDDIPF